MSITRELDNEACRCWLLNFHQVDIMQKDSNSQISALQLYFLTNAGETIATQIIYPPYFFVTTVPGMEQDVKLGLCDFFKEKIRSVTEHSKVDLSLPNHLSGIQQSVLKLSFHTQNDLVFVRNKLARSISRNARPDMQKKISFYTEKELDTALSEAIGSSTKGAALPPVEKKQTASSRKGSFWSMLSELREHDVPYDLRVCIDLQIFAGLWYDVEAFGGQTVLSPVQIDEKQESNSKKSKTEAMEGLTLIPPTLRCISFDIETTKMPLKFPQAATDQIFMISIMYETQCAELLINRTIVGEDIQDFHYFPRQEQQSLDITEGIESGGSVAVRVHNLDDEAQVINQFIKILKSYGPHVVVTYNGDNFDFPFLAARAKANNIPLLNGDDDMAEKEEVDTESGSIRSTSNKFGFGFLSNVTAHIDCLYWVKRDSYLPMGSHSLKAVTKMKLNYNPVEVDPEEMLPLAKRFPQRMASYSVSDVVATGELYQKYIQPFTFSLCTIIPYAPQKVLRRGSGALCEALLMKQAFARNIMYPNKVQDSGFGDSGSSKRHPDLCDEYKLRFHNGKLVDTETYIGGIVEALESGVFRCDVDIDFRTNSRAYADLIENVDEVLASAIAKELKEDIDWASVDKKADQVRQMCAKAVNFDAARSTLIAQLDALRTAQKIRENPNILHLDVGAMYPNIILTNRLQPTSIVNENVCAACVYNDLANRCQRKMDWIWRGTMLTATKAEVTQIIHQLEKESFPYAAIRKYMQADKNDEDDTQEKVLEKNNARGDEELGAYKKDNFRKRSYRPDQRSSFDRSSTFEDRQGVDKGKSRDTQSEYKFMDLPSEVQQELVKKRISEYCKKGRKKLHITQEERRSSIVCMRENSFYVDTVRLFRDRRYEYKAQTRHWKKELAKLEEKGGSSVSMNELNFFQQKVVQYDSLQTAHKCILNSFYGYVMRTGARWGSIEMAGIVTHLGGQIIHLARELAQSIGVPLELDTDGIWCCLPSSFPLNVKLEINDGNSHKSVSFNYACAVLNTLVQKKFSNDQYQDIQESASADQSLDGWVGATYPEMAADAQVGSIAPSDVPHYATRPTQCSIEFEVDGPHHAMILPASQDEGGSIKKRYAVYYKEFAGDKGSKLSYKLGELKGFEMKRRGELRILKEFQENVFDRFMLGNSLTESYASASLVARKTLEILLNQGYLPESGGLDEEEGYREVDDEDIMDMVTESRTLSKELSEYPPDQKSLALTTAKRLLKLIEMASLEDKESAWSGAESPADYAKNTKGLSCAFVVSKYPVDTPVTERALPTILFSDQITPATRKFWLTKWTGVSSGLLDEKISAQRDRNDRFQYLKMVLDWEYYTTRFSVCVQKIITIPAAIQGLVNPIPKISHPPWLENKLKKQRAMQGTLDGRRQLTLNVQSVPSENKPMEIEPEPANLPLPPFPLDAHQDLLKNLGVSGTARMFLKSPSFGPWLLHMSRKWSNTLKECTALRSAAATHRVSMSDSQTVLEKSSTSNDRSLVFILSASVGEDSIAIHALADGGQIPMRIALPMTTTVLINVTQELNLEAYTACLPKGLKPLISILAVSTESVVLPYHSEPKYLYALTLSSGAQESRALDESRLLECLQQNALPIRASQGQSALSSAIHVKNISQDGHICGIYPSSTGPAFEAIVNIGNIVRFRPGISMGEALPQNGTDAQAGSSQRQLSAFAGSRKTLRLTPDDLLPVSERQSAQKKSQTDEVYQLYASAVRSLPPLFVYHTSAGGIDKQNRSFSVVIVDVFEARGYLYIANESQCIESEKIGIDGPKRSKQRSKQPSGHKSVQKTIETTSITKDNIFAADTTLEDRLTALENSANSSDKWTVPNIFEKVVYSGESWNSMSREISYDIDSYIVKFHSKHNGRGMCVLQSDQLLLHDEHNSNALPSDPAHLHLTLSASPAIVPILRLPMNTADIYVQQEEDSADAQTYSVLTRCMHRYLFVPSSIAYMLEIAKFGRIPVCSVQYTATKSPESFLWDVAYARQKRSAGDMSLDCGRALYLAALKPRSTDLPYSAVDLPASEKAAIADNTWASGKQLKSTQYGVRIDVDTGVRRENTLVNPGFAASWSVELTLENLSIAALFVNDMQQEESSDIGAMLTKKQSPFGDIATVARTRMLRRIVETVSAQSDSAPGVRMRQPFFQAFSRWLASDIGFEPSTHDPAVQALCAHSTRKALAILVLFIQKRIGGKVIYVDTSRIIVGTDKKSLRECIAFAQHALTMCSDRSSDPTIARLFQYASVHVSSVWCPLLFISDKNFIGRRVEVEMAHGKVRTGASTIEYQWETSEVFPHAQQRKMFVAHLFYFMVLSSNLVDTSVKMAEEASRGAETGALRDVSPYFVISGIHKYLETSFQQQLLKQLDLFTHIGGDVCKYAGLFLRYLCAILQVTRTIEDAVLQSASDLHASIPEIMESVHQNACRILDAKVLTSDAHKALLQQCGSDKIHAMFMDMAHHDVPIGRIGYVLPHTILRDYTCPFCYNVQNVYLLNANETTTEPERPDAGDDAEPFLHEAPRHDELSRLQCIYCTFVFDNRDIESTLVSSLNEDINEYFAQDIVCKECGVCKETTLARHCSACVHGEIQCAEKSVGAQRGAFVGYQRSGTYVNQSRTFASMRESILACKIIADARDFQLLKEITSGYAAMFL